MSEILTREKLRELADAPHGQAAKYIREHVDPAFGTEGADSKLFKVKVVVEEIHTERTEYEVTLRALNENQAQGLAQLRYRENDPALRISKTSSNDDDEMWATAEEIPA